MFFSGSIRQLRQPEIVYTYAVCHLATSRRRSILGFRLHQVCGSLKRSPAELKWLGIVHLFLRRERLGCWAWVWRRNAMKWAYVLCDWGSLKNDDSAACHGQVGNQPDFFVVQVVVFGLLLDKLGDLVFQAAYVVQIGAQVVGDAAK